MATESPIIISETTGKWAALKKGAVFAPSSASMATNELGLLRKGHDVLGSAGSVVPNRSGSAPPNMEASVMAIGDLLARQNSSPGLYLANFDGDCQNCESEERLQANQTCLTSYRSNASLNPRLPRHRDLQLKTFSNNRKLTSIDDNNSVSSSENILSAHKEESEDDCSPKHSTTERVNRKNGLWSGNDGVQMAGQSRNLVDIIQEDFLRPASPEYNHSHSLGYETIEEEVDNDSDSSSLRGPSVSSLRVVSTSVGAQNIGLVSKRVASASYMSSSSSRDCTGSISCTSPTHARTSNDSDTFTKGNQKNQNLLNAHQQVSSSPQVQIAQSQGEIGAYVSVSQLLHYPSKPSPMVQPVVQSSGFTPPLYASAAAYMTSRNPIYSNVQVPGFYSHQYGSGGYLMNSSIGAPFVAGGFPFVLDAAAAPSFPSQTSGNAAHFADMQHLNKFYGQFGFPQQPSFLNPFHVQYYPQPSGEAFNMASQLEPSGSRGGFMGNQTRAHDFQKGSDVAVFDVLRYQHYRSGETENPSSSIVGMSSHYMGNPSNMGMFRQHPSSPLCRPVFPESSLARTGLHGGKNEMRFSSGSNRFSSWHGQRELESYNDHRMCNFLEELKSGKSQRFELSDIKGHIVEFSADQHGSRFIQQKLENCSVDEKASVFKEVLPHASKLITDVFGNYVIQKFFEYGSPVQRKELTGQLVGEILPLSMQMYGCRVIQKALETIELEQKAQLIRELDGNVVRCVRDQNGNHVIQKCVECIPAEKIGFIISAFRGQVATLSMHPYGCRVIQRVLEHCTDKHHCQFIVDEILDNVCALAQDQYGNYVTQHVLQRGKSLERSKIIRKLSGHIVQLSQHKFASNVVEKCLAYGGPVERELIIEEILGHNDDNDILLTMMKDQFANYVVQKIFELSSESQRVVLLSRIRAHAHVLNKYTYGKHIVARFDMLIGEENQTSGS